MRKYGGNVTFGKFFLLQVIPSGNMSQKLC